MQINTLINTLPCSKSYANRAIIYSYVQNLNSNILNLSNSDDVVNTKNAITSLEKRTSIVHLGEGGTTIRFMLCALALNDYETTVKVHPRFKFRPIKELFDYLRLLGATIKESSKEDVLCTIKGPLKKNILIDVDCTKTSQFASGLLLISERINLKLNLLNFHCSKSYFELTKKVMNDLKKESDIYVPVDSSSSVYFIVYALLNKNILFEQVLKRDRSQADDKIFDVLKLIGAKWKFTEKGLTVFKSDDLFAFEFDVSECLDLSMALVYLACHLKGQSTLYGIENLKYKEVDRLAAIKDILDSIGAEYTISTNSLSISGYTHKSDFNITPLSDHRSVMISALFLKSIGKEIAVNKNCVKKSFPNFFDLLSVV